MTVDDVLNEATAFVRSLMSSQLWRMANLFESPIEELFAAGLISADTLSPANQSVTLIARKAVYGEIDDRPADGVFCWPQAIVGPYRVDFLMCQRLRGETKWLVVECDGHAFHEATKEQAAKDKKRDRYLAGVGLPVLHFTGSEINRSPLACALEALDVLYPGDQDV